MNDECKVMNALAISHGITALHNYYPRRAWAATGIVVCLFVCLLTRGAWAATGYSSLSVCLFVTRGARGRPRV